MSALMDLSMWLSFCAFSAIFLGVIMADKTDQFARALARIGGFLFVPAGVLMAVYTILIPTAVMDLYQVIFRAILSVGLAVGGIWMLILIKPSKDK